MTRTELLDAALDVLRHDEPLTLDAVARATGLTKPGVVHHFPTKKDLTLGTLNHLIDTWEAQLSQQVGDDEATAGDRLRAYVRFALTAELDPSDLMLLSDLRLRDQLRQRWMTRLGPWFGETSTRDPERRAALRAARLIADGAWLNRALGTVDHDASERAAILAVALRLIDEGESA